MIRPISIAIVYGGSRSAQYAEAMKSLILSKCSELPVIPLLVNSTTRNGSVWTIIEETFKDSDYAFILLSEVYQAYTEEDRVKTLSMSTPNLMLEFGYLIHKLGKTNIKVVMDFDYNKTRSGSFVFPSDLQGDFRHSLPELRDAEDTDTMQRILSGVLDEDLRSLKEFHSLSNINDIMQQKVGMNAIFKQESMSDYSLEKQYSHIFSVWSSELNEFSQMLTINSKVRNYYVLSFVYSRVLFFAALHEINIGSIDVGRLKVSEEQFAGITNMPEATSYNAIIDYIVGSSNPNNNAVFFTDIATRLKTSTDMSLGLPDIIIKNYLGLCYLNASLRIRSSNRTQAVEMCNKAYELFDEVIMLAARVFEGTITETIIRSYAYFNRARAGSFLGNSIEAWTNDYNNAETYRQQLSSNSEFPLFLQDYYKRETYHCINGMIHSTMNWYESKECTPPNETVVYFKKREEDILDELKQYEQTVVAGQSFFIKAKDNATNNIAKLLTI